MQSTFNTEKGRSSLQSLILLRFAILSLMKQLTTTFVMCNIMLSQYALYLAPYLSMKLILKIINITA